MAPRWCMCRTPLVRMWPAHYSPSRKVTRPYNTSGVYGTDETPADTLEHSDG